MRRHGGVLALALLAACGSPVMEDGGLDAGDAGGPPEVDAGPDAGMDAGTDAGPFDAGVPSSVEMAAMSTATELAETEALIPAVPSVERGTAAFLNLDACMVGIDAIIGEDGLSTLSLGDGALRALADFQMAGRLLTLLDAAITVLDASPDPSVDAVVMSARELYAALALYRDELRALYQTRRDADPLFSMPYINQYANVQTAVASGQVIELGLVAENHPTTPTGVATINWVCTGTTLPNEVWAYDEETGAMTRLTSNPFNYVLEPGRLVHALRIVAIGVPRPVAAGPGHCDFRLVSDRVLRTMPRAFTGTAPFTAGSAYNDAIAAYEGSISQLTSANPQLGGAVERQIMLLHAVLAPVLGLAFGATPFVAFEDTDTMYRLHFYVNAMITQLRAAPQLMGQTLLLSQIAALQIAGQDLIAASRAR